jgi:hypothetical protein
MTSDDRRPSAEEEALIRRETAPVYTREDAPRLNGYSLYRKVLPVTARRMFGPFRVRTREGELLCEDGWLAIDSGGYPYPIADDEFSRIYEPVPTTPTPPPPSFPVR